MKWDPLCVRRHTSLSRRRIRGRESPFRRFAAPGVVRADALFGTPDVVAIVEADDLAAMDAVIDSIVGVPEVVGTDSRVVRRTA